MDPVTTTLAGISFLSSILDTGDEEELRANARRAAKSIDKALALTDEFEQEKIGLSNTKLRMLDKDYESTYDTILSGMSRSGRKLSSDVGGLEHKSGFASSGAIGREKSIGMSEISSSARQSTAALKSETSKSRLGLLEDLQSQLDSLTAERMGLLTQKEGYIFTGFDATKSGPKDWTAQMNELNQQWSDYISNRTQVRSMTSPYVNKPDIADTYNQRFTSVDQWPFLSGYGSEGRLDAPSQIVIGDDDSITTNQYGDVVNRNRPEYSEGGSMIPTQELVDRREDSKGILETLVEKSRKRGSLGDSWKNFYNNKF